MLFAGEGVHAAAYFADNIQRGEFKERFDQWKVSILQPLERLICACNVQWFITHSVIHQFALGELTDIARPVQGKFFLKIRSGRTLRLSIRFQSDLL